MTQDVGLQRSGDWDTKNEAINLLHAELNPICYLLALLRAHHILNVSRIMVKSAGGGNSSEAHQHEKKKDTVLITEYWAAFALPLLQEKSYQS